MVVISCTISMINGDMMYNNVRVTNINVQSQWFMCVCCHVCCLFSSRVTFSKSNKLFLKQWEMDAEGFLSQWSIFHGQDTLRTAFRGDILISVKKKKKIVCACVSLCLRLRVRLCVCIWICTAETIAGYVILSNVCVCVQSLEAICHAAVRQTYPNYNFYSIFLPWVCQADRCQPWGCQLKSYVYVHGFLPLWEPFWVLDL